MIFERIAFLVVGSYLLFIMAYKCDSCGAVKDVDIDGLTGVYDLNRESDCCDVPDYRQVD